MNKFILVSKSSLKLSEILKVALTLKSQLAWKNHLTVTGCCFFNLFNEIFNARLVYLETLSYISVFNEEPTLCEFVESGTRSQILGMKETCSNHPTRFAPHMMMLTLSLDCGIWTAVHCRCMWVRIETMKKIDNGHPRTPHWSNPGTADHRPRSCGWPMLHMVSSSCKTKWQSAESHLGIPIPAALIRRTTVTSALRTLSRQQSQKDNTEQKKSKPNK